MYRYRIYTEDTEGIKETVRKFFPSFTIFKGTGCYLDSFEDSSVIEILSQDYVQDDVQLLCNSLFSDHGQESVMVTREVVDGWEEQ